MKKLYFIAIVICAFLIDATLYETISTLKYLLIVVFFLIIKSQYRTSNLILITFIGLSILFYPNLNLSLDKDIWIIFDYALSALLSFLLLFEYKKLAKTDFNDFMKAIISIYISIVLVRMIVETYRYIEYYYS